jgi:ferredoxin
MAYFVVNDHCNGCLACVENCPANALSFKDNGQRRTILHNMARCVRCANCWRVCPQHAVEFQHFLENEWDEVKSLDLIYCRVCGEPIYTADFQDTLTGKTGREIDALCPKHKELDFAARQAPALSGRRA